jgi:radical SAM protein with 4Fe4S-binding SPASM domain
MKTSDIEELVAENPGISFGEMKEETGAANGQLQYHLKKADVEKHGRGYVKTGVCSDCQLQEFCKGKCMRFFIRQEDKRKILEELDKRKKIDIADDLDLTPSTLSYHIEELKENNLIQDGEVTPEVKRLL